MRFIAIFLLAITLLSVSVNGQGSTSSCSFNSIDYGGAANATSYSALSLASGASAAGKYRFYWNICAAASKCNSAVVAACQLTVGDSATPTSVGSLALGSFAAPKAPSTSPILTYTTNTSPCGGGAFRSIDITLTCGSGPVVVSGVAEEAKCTYGVTMTGASLCGGGSTDSQGNPTNPTKGGIGGGWIFIIILLSVIVVYIVGGVIFNAKVKHLHGSEMFPNRDLWVNFGGLIKDGVFFIKSKVTGGGNGYQQV